MPNMHALIQTFYNKAHFEIVTMCIILKVATVQPPKALESTLPTQVVKKNQTHSATITL